MAGTGCGALQAHVSRLLGQNQKRRERDRSILRRRRFDAVYQRRAIAQVAGDALWFKKRKDRPCRRVVRVRAAVDWVRLGTSKRAITPKCDDLDFECAFEIFIVVFLGCPNGGRGWG